LYDELRKLKQQFNIMFDNESDEWRMKQKTYLSE
jgi:hypothetical protein